MDSLSIIILNYNTYHLTCDCISSIYASNLEGLDIEVILVDNGSSEPCPVPFNELFKEIVYVKSDENLGFAKGNNLGIQHATKAYILLLNSDTKIVDPDTFYKTLQEVKRCQNNIVLTSQLLTEFGDSQVAYGALPRIRHELLLTTFFYKVLPKRNVEDLLITFVPNQSRLIEDGYITATFLLFSRKALDVLPGKKLYDKTFLYGEEFFWAAEWLRLGIKMYYYSNVSIIHLIGQSSKRSSTYTSKVRRFYQLSAEYQYLRATYGVLNICLFYALRIFRFLVLCPFDRDIRVRFLVLLRVIFRQTHFQTPEL